MNQLDRPAAYEVKDDYLPEPFKVKKTANAWWKEKGKVYALLFAFKMHCTVKQACIWANISVDQYKHFLEVHPDFSTIKQQMGQVMIFRAMDTINKHLDDPRVAMHYLDRMDYWSELKEERKARIEAKETVNTEALEKALSQIADEMIAQRNRDMDLSGEGKG